MGLKWTSQLIVSNLHNPILQVWKKTNACANKVMHVNDWSVLPCALYAHKEEPNNHSHCVCAQRRTEQSFTCAESQSHKKGIDKTNTHLTLSTFTFIKLTLTISRRHFKRTFLFCFSREKCLTFHSDFLQSCSSWEQDIFFFFFFLVIHLNYP